MLERALEIQRRSLRPEDPGTLGTLDNLGWTLYQSGHPKEAEKLLRPALDGRRRALGINDPPTQTTMSELGPEGTRG